MEELEVGSPEQVESAKRDRHPRAIQCDYPADAALHSAWSHRPGLDLP